MGGTVDGGIRVTTYQAQSSLTSTRGSQTWPRRRGHAVGPAHQPRRRGNMGTFSYDNTYTRASDEANSTALPGVKSRLEPRGVYCWACRPRCRLPTITAFDRPQQLSSDVRAGHVALRTKNLTLNLGLRIRMGERHQGSQNRACSGSIPRRRSRWGPVQAAYAANPQAVSPSTSSSSRAGQTCTRARRGAPRSHLEARGALDAAFFVRLQAWATRTSSRGGYGVYYDTLNARDWTPNQDGYDVTTSQPAQQRLRPDLQSGESAAGILPLANPFPVRDTGSRYELVPGNALGADNVLGGQLQRGEPQPSALARAAVALWLAARASLPDGDGSRLFRVLWRSAGDFHSPGLLA
jgi:hypothetical protein